MKILVLNGPNLNLLGKRPSQHYGSLNLAELEDLILAEGDRLNLDVVCRQSNHEGELIDWIHASLEDGTAGMLLNAGAYTHTSLAIADALEVVTYPVIEVHLSNIHAREPIRQHSMIASRVLGQISGLGPQGYVLALQALTERLGHQLPATSH